MNDDKFIQWCYEYDADKCEQLKQYVSQDAKPRGTNNCSALMIAAQYHFTKAVQFLSQYEMNQKDDQGCTALMYLCGCYIVQINYETEAQQNQDATKIQACLDYLIGEAGEQNYKGVSALMFAAKSGFKNGVMQLIEKEAGLQDESGETALIYAIETDNVQCALMLLHKEYHFANKDGRTALMHAAYRLQYDIVLPLSTMLSKLKDNRGKTAMMYCVICPLRTRQLLLGNVEEQKQTSRIVEQLAAFEIGLQDNDGQTALMFALQNSYYQSIKYLMDESKIIANNGCTALMCAFQYVYDINDFKILEQLQFLMSRQTDQGETLLMMLASDCLLTWEYFKYSNNNQIHDTVTETKKPNSTNNCNSLKNLLEKEGRLVNNKGKCALEMLLASVRNEIWISTDEQTHKDSLPTGILRLFRASKFAKMLLMFAEHEGSLLKEFSDLKVILPYLKQQSINQFIVLVPALASDKRCLIIRDDIFELNQVPDVFGRCFGERRIWNLEYNEFFELLE